MQDGRLCGLSAVVDAVGERGWDGEEGHQLASVGTVGVAGCHESDGGQGRHVHELSHHIGGRGGEQGGKTAQVSIWPPQQGQTSMS